MSSNDILTDDLSNSPVKFSDDLQKYNILSTPNSKTSFTTKSLSKQKKSKRRDCTPDSPPDSTCLSYSAFWTQLRNKDNGNDKYIEPKALFTETKGKSKYLNLMEDTIIEETEKDDKLFKNLFGSLMTKPPTQSNDNLLDSIRTIMSNLNENHLDHIDSKITKVILINQCLSSSYMKTEDLKEIFIRVEPDYSQSILSDESNCFIIKAKLNLNSSNQVKKYNSRFLFSRKDDGDELMLSEIEVHLM